MNFKFTLIIVLLFCSIFAFTQNEAFTQANDAFQQKKYQNAIQQYEDILQKEQHSTELYFNLANAYYKNNDLGKAILNYERALLLSPTEEDVLYNLELAKAQRIDEIELLPPFFLAAWWQGMRRTASSTGWSIIALLLLWLGIGGFVLFFIGKERQKKKWGLIGGVIATLLCILPFSLAYSKASMEKNSGEAIILAKDVNLKSGPDAASTTLNELHEGTKVQLLDDVETWHQVRLPNGEIGWLEMKEIEEI